LTTSSILKIRQKITLKKNPSWVTRCFSTRINATLIERLLSLPELQGAGGAAVVGYRKRPATQQIRLNRQARRVSNGDIFLFD